MKTIIRPSKQGSVLVLVMLVVVSFSLITLALLQLGSLSEKETVKELRATQAHWLAEAGLERALSRIKASRDYRDMLPDTMYDTETLADVSGSYSVQMTITGDPDSLARYTIVSTGTVTNDAIGATSTVRLTFEGAPGVSGPLISQGGSSVIANGDNTIIGDIYANANLHVGNNTTIDGIVEVTGNLTGSAVTEGDLPDPLVTLDTTSYQSLLTHAGDTNNTDVLNGDFTSSNPSLVFNGTTNYVHGNLIINTPVPDGEMLVATDNITVANNITIGEGSSIIANGNILFGNHVELEGETTVFTFGNISFSTQGATATNGTSLLAVGNIDPAKNLDFSGVMFAEGSINVTSGSEINGSIIAGQGFVIDANVDITYDPSVYISTNLLNYGNGLAIQVDTWLWEEL